MKNEKSSEANLKSTWIDVTLAIGENMPVFPGDPPLHVGFVFDLDRGDPINLKRFEMTGHSGTHVDAPRHLFPDGKSIAELEPGLFMGPARIVYVPTAGAIEREVLQSVVSDPPERLIVRTLASEAWGQSNYRDFPVPFLTPSAARWLLEQPVRLFGLDSLSVDPVESGELPAHRILLRADVVVIEALNLMNVDPGDYWLHAAPLLIAGGDGSPVRALLKPIQQ